MPIQIYSVFERFIFIYSESYVEKSLQLPLICFYIPFPRVHHFINKLLKTVLINQY